MRRLFFILLLCFPVVSSGQTLEEYLIVASENNPGLKAAYNDYMAAMEQVPQVGALPDPELGFGFFIRPMQFPMGNQRADLQLMQMFPWFGTLRTRRDEASKMALARFEVFQNAKNELHYQVKNTWYELYQLEEEIRFTNENLEILKSFERLAMNRYRAGASGMADVLRVKMQIKELEAQLELLDDNKVPLRTEFNRYLHRDLEEPVSITDTLSVADLPVGWRTWADSMMQHNPMLRMLDAEKDALEDRKRMARLEGRPMFGVGLNYMVFSPLTENGAAVGGHNMVMPMVKMSLPVYRRKYRAMANEADFGQKAVELRKEDMQNELMTEWSRSVRDLENSERKIRLYQEQEALARQTLDILLTSYASDGQDFEEVLRMQQQLIDYQLKLVNALVDQHATVAMLEMLAATGLD
ncbi:TolC family protein [Cytophagaceae bacterium ABcell3]|nr:TolC family protein [Cytophagaceae bacterium ABcell3]